MNMYCWKYPLLSQDQDSCSSQCKQSKPNHNKFYLRINAWLLKRKSSLTLIQSVLSPRVT